MKLLFFFSVAVIQEIVKLDAVMADARALIMNCLKPLAAGQDVAIFCEQTQGLRLNLEIFLLGVTKHFLPTDFIPLGKFVKL
jgi:hypothetical protein